MLQLVYSFFYVLQCFLTHISDIGFLFQCDHKHEESAGRKKEQTLSNNFTRRHNLHYMSQQLSTNQSRSDHIGKTRRISFLDWTQKIVLRSG